MRSVHSAQEVAELADQSGAATWRARLQAMIQCSVLKASLAGVAVFVPGNMLYLAFSHHELLRLLLLGTPGFAAFVAAYWAPRWKMAVGMSMAIYGVVRK